MPSGWVGSGSWTWREGREGGREGGKEGGKEGQSEE